MTFVFLVGMAACKDSTDDSAAGAPAGSHEEVLARGPGSTAGWERMASIDFTAMLDQDLTIAPTFDTHWTVGHERRASTFAIESGTGLVITPNHSTSWTASSNWTEPYISAQVRDLIGTTYKRGQWISIIAEFTLDSTALYPGSGLPGVNGTPLTEADLSYGPSHTGLQYYRSEQRSYISTAYVTPIARTWAGVQGASPAGQPAHPTFMTVMELQIRDGVVLNYVGTSFPMKPGEGMIETPTVTPGNERYPLEKRDPEQAYEYDPATDVVALSCGNYYGGDRTCIWKKVEIWLAH
jgi:hypothetical protein